MNRRMTNMTNRNVINNIEEFSSIFEQVFSNFFNEINSGSFDNFFNDDDFIKVDMRESRDSYLIEGVFPGIDKKDIKIDYKDDYVYLNVNRREVFSNGYNMSMMISQFGDGFSREFFVPDSDAARLKASFENYRLRLEIPKFNYELPSDECKIIDVVDFKEE